MKSMISLLICLVIGLGAQFTWDWSLHYATIPEAPAIAESAICSAWLYTPANGSRGNEIANSYLDNINIYNAHINVPGSVMFFFHPCNVSNGGRP